MRSDDLSTGIQWNLALVPLRESSSTEKFCGISRGSARKRDLTNKYSSDETHQTTICILRSKIHIHPCPCKCLQTYIYTDYQETQDVETMLVWCWASVEDGGPTSNQHWFRVWSMPGLATYRPLQNSRSASPAGFLSAPLTYFWPSRRSRTFGM